MTQSIITYFKAEKGESLLFMLIGLIALGLAIWFYFKNDDSFYRGLAMPLAAIALIQLVVGSTVYFKSDKQIADNTALYQNDTSQLKQAEIPRMELVMKNFKAYKILETAFVLVGIALLLLMKEKPFWLGLGVGLFVQGGLMLVLDIFAEKRGLTYLEWLQNL